MLSKDLRLSFVIIFTILGFALFANLANAESWSPAAPLNDRMEALFKQQMDWAPPTKAGAPPAALIKSLSGKWATIPPNDLTNEFAAKSITKFCADFAMDISQPRNAVPDLIGQTRRKSGSSHFELRWIKENSFVRIDNLDDEISSYRLKLQSPIADDELGDWMLYSVMAHESVTNLQFVSANEDIIVAARADALPNATIWIRCPAAGAPLAATDELITSVVKIGVELQKRLTLTQRAEDGTFPLMQLLQGSWTQINWLFIQETTTQSLVSLCDQRHIKLTSKYLPLPIVSAEIIDNNPDPMHGVFLHVDPFELRFAANDELLWVPTHDPMENLKTHPQEFAFPKAKSGDFAARKEQVKAVSRFYDLAVVADHPVTFSYIDDNTLIESLSVTTKDPLYQNHQPFENIWLRCPVK